MKRKSIIERLSIFMALILVILTSGCATTVTRMYKGDELPIQEIAVITQSSKRFPMVEVHICSVYEELLESPLAGSLKVEVMPGFHKVVVSIHWAERDFWDLSGLFTQHFLYFCILEFTAEAGHQYKIKARDLWGKSCPSIAFVDIQSGAVIANSRDCSSIK